MPRKTKKQQLKAAWGAAMFAGNSALLKKDKTGRRVFAQDLVASMERRGLLPLGRKTTANKKAKLRGMKGWHEFYLNKAYKDLGVPYKRLHGRGMSK